MEQTQRQHQSIQTESSNVIKCTNSQAIKAGKCIEKTPTIKCKYCNKELEQTGFYIANSSLLKKWLCQGKYERCTCKVSIGYWKIFDDAEMKNKLKTEKEEKERLYYEKLRRVIAYSNLGERFKTRMFSTYNVTNENKKAFNDCKDYAERFKDLKDKGIGLLLTGNFGAGKTHLAAAIAHEIIKQGYQPIFGTLITLLGKVKATYSDSYSKENEEQIINRYINCDLLIIDDLGKEKPTEWVIEKLYYIINCRYENNKPIVITSNYNDTKLMDRLTVGDNLETSEAIVSRMYEVCQGVDMRHCKDYRRE